MSYGNQALDKEDQLGYQLGQQSYKKASDRTDVLNYQYDPSLSDINTAVYHDHANRKTHVSNRGSTSAYDWLI